MVDSMKKRGSLFLASLRVVELMVVDVSVAGW